MYIGKIDWVIGIAAFIVMVVIFNIQPFQPQEPDYSTERPPTGSGTQTPGDDSSVIMPSGGDIPVEPEDDMPEYAESPKTGESGLWMTRISIVEALVAFIFCCVFNNNKHIRRKT